MSKLRAPLIGALVVLALGFASGFFSGSAASDPWFVALRKPAFMPPGWAFPVAWTLLYLATGAAAGLVWRRPHRLRTAALAAFGAQLVLNLAWSPLFFSLHRVAAALVVIALMIAATAVTAALFAVISRTAGVLMAPYFAWLLFAVNLNAAILHLNPGA